MTRLVLSAAAAALTVVIVAAGASGHGRARAVTPRPSKVAASSTTSPTVIVSPKPEPAPTPTVARAATTVAVARKHPTTPRTTTKPDPAQRLAERKQALEGCLELAAANNVHVIAANLTWYQQELSRIAAHPKRARGQYEELQIQEDEAHSEIQAQYTIDEANCYLKG